MGPITALLSVALATHAISVDQYPLRKGCNAGESVIVHLHKGDPVEIRFALAGENGTCYKIAVQSEDKTLQGYVSAEAITDLARFEQARRNAPTTNSPVTHKAASNIVRPSVAGRGYQDPGAKAARLLDQHKPNEALEVLEAALRANRRDAGLLSLAGYAAYQSDDMRHAMEYWKESLEMHPNPSVEQLYKLAEKESQEDKSSQKLVGMRFMLRFNRDQVWLNLSSLGNWPEWAISFTADN